MMHHKNNHQQILVIEVLRENFRMFFVNWTTYFISSAHVLINDEFLGDKQKSFIGRHVTLCSETYKLSIPAKANWKIDVWMSRSVLK